MKHGINKRDGFVNTPGQRFISDAVKSHANSSIHKSSFEIEFTQRFSVFEKEVVEKKEVKSKCMKWHSILHTS